MGGTNNTMYQLLDKSDNKGNIMKFLDSKLIHFLLKITQFSESPNHKNEFKILNMITKPNNGTLKTDEDIYKYYGIKKDEQKLIDEVVNHVKPTKRTPKKKQTIKGEFGSNPKYANFKDSDLLPEGFEPEPEPDPDAPRVINKSRTKKKSKSKSKEKKKKQTQTKKKGGRRKNKRTTRKRRR